MATTNTAEFAQETAERRCFEFLLKKLGSIRNVNGHLGEFPKDIYASAAKANEWHFELGGGEGVAHSPNERPMASHHMQAQWTFRSPSRELCLRMLGLLRNILPAGEDVDGAELEGIQEFARDAEPGAPERTVILVRTGAAGRRGGELRVWQVVQPLYVVFNNQERIS